MALDEEIKKTYPMPPPRQTEKKSKYAQGRPRSIEMFQHGVLDDRPAERLCLRCNKPFNSLGPCHRICRECRPTFNAIAEDLLEET